MKLLYTPLISIIFCTFFSIVSFSQDEIKNYSPPGVSEGRNLYINSSPIYVNRNSNDGYDHSELLINLDGNYINWRFTPKLVYAAYLHTRLLFHRYSSNEDYENNTNMISNNEITGGISYYISRDRFYIGLYDESYFDFGNHAQPSSGTHMYPNIGYGYIVNAERVTEMMNLEQILLDEEIIKQPLSATAKKKITELLDRRNNNEFTDKYKDDADVEFFTELESVLIKEGVINFPLSSRTALKFFQSLTNSKFVYFPKYKGYLIQSEFETNTQKIEPSTYKVFSSIIFSGLYGLPIKLRTELVGVISLEIPFTDVIGYYNYHFPFHSPLAIQENQQMQNYYPKLIPGLSGLGDNDKYNYILGTNAFVFYNLTNTAGISGNIGFTAGKKNNGFNYSLRVSSMLLYNILNKLQFNSGVTVLKNHDIKFYFVFSSGFNFYIF